MCRHRFYLDVDDDRAMVTRGLDIRPVDVWIRHHHEHWDGSGYPHGLASEEIPFGSRLILVADAYDALYRDWLELHDHFGRKTELMKRLKGRA